MPGKSFRGIFKADMYREEKCSNDEIHNEETIVAAFKWAKSLLATA